MSLNCCNNSELLWNTVDVPLWSTLRHINEVTPLSRSVSVNVQREVFGFFLNSSFGFFLYQLYVHDLQSFITSVDRGHEAMFPATEQLSALIQEILYYVTLYKTL